MGRRIAIGCLILAVFASACGDGASGGRADGGAPKLDGDVRSDGADDGSTPSGDWWKPTADAPIPWHWQLTGDFDLGDLDQLPNKKVFDLDGETTTKETVAALHALGPEVKVICYFDAGVYENYRSDASRFPASIIGKQDIGWPGSYWLDIRRLDLLMPILKDRMQHWCKDKGFDAIEPDETEVWSNASGFPLTKADNVAFHQAISAMAHSMGLSVGLKGNNTEAVELEPLYDWALSEQCFQYGECTFFRDGFVAKNKAVFTVEYDVSPNCTQANAWHLNSSRRDLDLVGPTQSGYLYQPCVPDSRDTW